MLPMRVSTLLAFAAKRPSASSAKWGRRHRDGAKRKVGAAWRCPDPSLLRIELLRKAVNAKFTLASERGTAVPGFRVLSDWDQEE